MKPALWLSPLIFIAGYSPLVLILLIKDWDSQSWTFAHPASAWAFISITSASIFITLASLRSIHGGLPVEIVSVKDRSGNLIEYSLPYIVSFLDIEIGEPKTLLMLGVFMGILFLVSARTQTLYMSPILLLAEYKLSEVELLDATTKKTRFVLHRRAISPGDLLIVQKFTSETLFAPDERTNSRQDSGSERTTQAAQRSRSEQRSHQFVGASS